MPHHNGLNHLTSSGNEAIDTALDILEHYHFPTMYAEIYKDGDMAAVVIDSEHGARFTAQFSATGDEQAIRDGIADGLRRFDAEEWAENHYGDMLNEYPDISFTEYRDIIEGDTDTFRQLTDMIQNWIEPTAIN